MTTEQRISMEMTVPFHDVDPMNIVWHGRYVKYLEVARCELLESFCYSYSDMFESGYSWPVVDMRIKYVKPATFGQKIRVTATVVEWDFRLKINYLIEDIETGNKLTKGYTIQVAVDMSTEEMCGESPDILLEKLGVTR